MMTESIGSARREGRNCSLSDWSIRTETTGRQKAVLKSLLGIKTPHPLSHENCFILT
jgi:hypothetical protein